MTDAEGVNATEREPRTHATSDEKTAILDLVNRSSLLAIEFHEISARRLTENKQREESEDNVDVSMQLESYAKEKRFGIRLVVELLPFMGEVQVSVAAEYEVNEGDDVSDALVRGFANEVAVMALFPYMRQAVSDIAMRVFNKPLLLPTIQRGEVGFDLDEDPAAGEA